MTSFERLQYYVSSYTFVQRAIIVGALIALCAALLGVTLVLKRSSFIGHGLSNVAFGAIAIALALNFAQFDFLLVLPITVICAIILMRLGKNAKINADAAIAMISVGSMGIGFLVFSIFPPSANLTADVCDVLFGSTAILTLTSTEVLLSAILSAVVVVVFLIFYHQIFSVTFDEDFSTATGTKANKYNLILAVIIAIVIVLAINLVGSLLITALVIFPALSAMRIFKSFKSVTICSVFVSVICAILGIFVSILASTPVGSTIVAVQVAVFILFGIAGFIKRRV